MSRKSSNHIRRLEDSIRHAIQTLTAYGPHPQVLAHGCPLCQCIPCRALRGLRATTLQTKDPTHNAVASTFYLRGEQVET